ncbi:excalibur calcium-binding domain-containing protein [Streptomyces anulatus]|nr:excalibur calcium-binding domain-containing protein [Streptomyces sp. TSRI0395]
MLALGGILNACTSSDSENPEPGVTTQASTPPEESSSPPSAESDTISPSPSLERERREEPSEPETEATAERSQSPGGGVTSDAPGDVFYEDCDAARVAGAAPLMRGGSGYRDELDRDGDGVACEPAP